MCSAQLTERVPQRPKIISFVWRKKSVHAQRSLVLSVGTESTYKNKLRIKSTCFFQTPSVADFCLLLVPLIQEGQFFQSPLLSILYCTKVTFKKNSAVKIIGNGSRETRKRVASFLTRNKRGQTCTLPRLSRESYRQGAADRGIFSHAKIREQRL